MALASNCEFFDAGMDVLGSVLGGARPSEVVVVAHSAEALAAPSAQLQALLVPGALAALQELGARAKAGKESSGSAETLVAAGNGTWQRLAVGLLPTQAASRSCAPGHPHVVTELVKKLVGGSTKEACVVLALKDPASEAFAACCAIPRAFSLFSMKSGAPAAPPRVRVLTGTAAEQPLLADRALGRAVALGELAAVAAGIQECARLVDMPPNVLNVNDYVARARELAAQLDGVEVLVLQGEELRLMGMGGLYGVGCASAQPSALVVLSHKGRDAAAKSVCFVGKGIVYDTGGLSIKVPPNMAGMKHDMGGSAGLLGAFVSLVKTGGLECPLHCVLCIAENSVSTLATRPDDVHTFYSGRTVEVNNTDAEGRLVLADGLAYAARHLNPGCMLDMATLTGAQSVATGVKHAALYTNSESLEQLAVRAGKLSGDLTHPLPYAPEFFKPEFKSEVADMRNSAKNKGNCGSGAPAAFIGNHIEEYISAGHPWLHIDMAYPVANGDRATGYGVALVYLLTLGLPKL